MGRDDGDEIMTTAMLDRFLDHTNIFTLPHNLTNFLQMFYTNLTEIIYKDIGC